MSDIRIRREGCAGRITLTRPQAMNALTYDMAMAIARALDQWEDEANLKCVVIDAEGERAFCAGGDIAELYRTGMAGDYAYGRRFWADEYRMNARLAKYPAMVVSFMQGFVMGGGVGIGCHGAQRVVGESTRMSMPECGIGLVPDVGGTLLLAKAPGRLGTMLGLTGHRMGPGDAIHAGFADYFIPEPEWPALIAELCETGSAEVVDGAAHQRPVSPLKDQRARIDTLFAGNLPDILAALRADPEAADWLKAVTRGSPLSLAATVLMLDRLRGTAGIADALALEYRFTARAMEHGDFLEGIRAAVIDKDRRPRWRHGLDEVTRAEAEWMLSPLDEEWEERP